MRGETRELIGAILHPDYGNTVYFRCPIDDRKLRIPALSRPRRRTKTCPSCRTRWSFEG